MRRRCRPLTLTAVVSDERRGKKDVLSKTMRGLEACLRERILTGVATSVCQSNIDDLTLAFQCHLGPGRVSLTRYSRVDDR